jgi:putative copper export protein
MASIKRDRSRGVLTAALVLLMLAVFTGALGRETMAAALFGVFICLTFAGHALSDNGRI